MNYFGISKTYREALELDAWIRRRVRLYHWKQWKRPRTRRRNSIVQHALSNQRLKEQGAPELRRIWIKLQYGEAVKQNR
jgi:RNA-directed DNA polymerase